MKAVTLNSFLLGNEKAQAQYDREVAKAVREAVRIETTQARALAKAAREEKKTLLAFVREEGDAYKFHNNKELKTAVKDIVANVTKAIRDPARAAI